MFYCLEEQIHTRTPNCLVKKKIPVILTFFQVHFSILEGIEIIPLRYSLDLHENHRLT